MVPTRKILLADDDTSIRNIIRLYFQQIGKGYIIEEASNGLHALQKIKSGYKPDFIITDYHMSGLNGIQFLNEVKEIHACPVLFMSGNSNISVVQTAIKSGAVNFLIKPFDMKTLFSFVNNHFDSKEKGSTSKAS